MAEFCKEICCENGWSFDFSIFEMFSFLKEGESIKKICEGCGFVQIAKIDGVCYVGFREWNSIDSFDGSSIIYRQFDFENNKIK
ncbi:MAG: hypothetical protein H8E84_04940 [Flavobacteriales bacterium]|nr:hypothetical protein [Flavobacteriales bacterium]